MLPIDNSPLDWTVSAKDAAQDRAGRENVELVEIDTRAPWFDQVLQKSALGHPVTMTAYQLASEAKARANR